MRNSLRYGNMLSFEIFTRKLAKKENPFQENSKQYEIFKEMKELYNKEFRDIIEVCRVARKLCT